MSIEYWTRSIVAVSYQHSAFGRLFLFPLQLVSITHGVSLFNRKHAAEMHEKALDACLADYYTTPDTTRSNNHDYHRNPVA